MDAPHLCSARRGLFGHCALPVLHPGDHCRDGVLWQRSPREQAAYDRAQLELARLRDAAVRGLLRDDDRA